ncbi:MAG: hypothetical protein KME52_22165 [Desmonostoc geniculatum HA4340-LM1]|jgi:hypothetical protein|nr:hypothetical protein [Desmonostoc geniculatum HA4340-LM1]
MGIIYIGDRQAGKTHLAMESSNPQGNYVKGKEGIYKKLQRSLYDTVKDSTIGTNAEKSIYHYTLELDVKIRLRSKQIIVDWFDTPGEIWRKSWQSNNPDEWNLFLQASRSSEAIMLILPPHRGLDLKDPDLEEPPGPFSTQEQWCNRFDEWVRFFCQDCPKSKHLLICLNKADLFCNLNEQAEELDKRDWQDRHEYVSHRYFRPIRSQIQQINNNFSGLSIRCFITSVKSRPLLELPWQYLGIYLN